MSGMSEAPAEETKARPQAARYQPLVIVLVAVCAGIAADHAWGVPACAWSTMAGVAWAAAPADYALDWWTVDGGGGTWSDTGGQYELNGTVGQPDAHVWGDDDYTLTGGFWGGAEVQYRAYIPLVLKE